MKGREERIDLDELGGCLLSAAYRAIEARYEYMVKTKLNELLSPLDPDETNRARGFVEGVRACQRIPQVLREEISARSSGGTKRKRG